MMAEFSDAYVCLTRPQWVKPIEAEWRIYGSLNWQPLVQWLVAWLAPSHYLNQCWDIVNWTQGTNFTDIFIKIHMFSSKKMHFNHRPFCLGLNVLRWPSSSNHSWPDIIPSCKAWILMNLVCVVQLHLLLILTHNTTLTHWYHRWLSINQFYTCVPMIPLVVAFYLLSFYIT